jgi:hypothetical protein
LGLLPSVEESFGEQAAGQDEQAAGQDGSVAEGSVADRLKELLPEVEGEPYEVTLARALVSEWSSAFPQGAVLSEGGFEDDYPLTTLLVDEKRLKVSVSYESVLATLEAAEALVREGRNGVNIYSAEAAEALAALEALEVAGTPDTADTSSTSEVATDEASGSLASLRVAYELAGKLQLPYGVNGVIDTAVFTLFEGAQAQADPVALQVALEFDRRGAAGELPYPHFGSSRDAETEVKPATAAAEGVGDVAAAGAEGTEGEIGADAAATAETGADAAGATVDVTQEVTGANYYALLVQQGEYAEVMFAVAQETGLACELSPRDRVGHYGIIALLSGATRESYGLNHSGIKPLPPLPPDPLVTAPFL